MTRDINDLIFFILLIFFIVFILRNRDTRISFCCILLYIKLDFWCSLISNTFNSRIVYVWWLSTRSKCHRLHILICQFNRRKLIKFLNRCFLILWRNRSTATQLLFFLELNCFLHFLFILLQHVKFLFQFLLLLFECKLGLWYLLTSSRLLLSLVANPVRLQIHLLFKALVLDISKI